MPNAAPSSEPTYYSAPPFSDRTQPNPFDGPAEPLRTQAADAHSDDAYWGGPPASAPVEPPRKFSGGAPKGSTFDRKAEQANKAERRKADPDESFWGSPAPSYYDAPSFEETHKETAPAAPAPPKPLWRRALDYATGEGKATGSLLYSAAQGLGETTNTAASVVNMMGGVVAQSAEAWSDLLTGKIKSIDQLKGPASTNWQDAWFRATVDPTMENASSFATDQDAPFSVRAMHAIGSTLGYISQSILTAGEGGEVSALAGQGTETTLKSGMQMAGESLAHGAKAAQAPAVAQAITAGREVYDATGNGKLATKVATSTYLSGVVSNMGAISAPGNLATRMATGGAIQGLGAEESRELNNQMMPDDMSDQDKRGLSDDALTQQNQLEAGVAGLRQPFDAQNTALNVGMGAIMGGVMGPRKALPGLHGDMPHQAVETTDTIMDHAVNLVREDIARAGGDALDQTVGAAHVNAVLGAHHDAARYEMHLEEGHAAAAEAANQAAAAQTPNELRLESAQEEAARSPSAAFDQAEAAQPAQPSPDDAYAARDQERAAQKNQDYSAAQNQLGDQTIAAADAGAKGFEPPTLGDNPVFKSLKERRAAAGADEPVPTVAERLKAQDPDDNFTPYTAPKTLADRRMAAGADVAKPPQTLAERKSAAGADNHTSEPGSPDAGTANAENAPSTLATRRAVAGPGREAVTPIRTLAGKRAEAAGATQTEEPQPLTVSRDASLTGHDAEVQERFAKQIEADPDKAMRDYDAMPETQGGKIIAADLARRLSPDYQTDPTGSTTGTDHPSGWLANRLFERRMAEPSDGRRVIMTAGGTGSGKTTTLLRAYSDGELGDPHTIYDSTMSGYAAAKRRVDLARGAGRQVAIHYTYRDPVEAFRNGVLPRAMGKTKRIVPIDNHANTHIGAQRTVERLQNGYANDRGVSVNAIENRAGQDPRNVDPSSLPKRSSAMLKRQLREVLDHEYQAGRVSPEVYRATAGHEPPGASEAIGERVGGNAEDNERTERVASGKAPEGVLDEQFRSGKIGERVYRAATGREPPSLEQANVGSDRPSVLRVGGPDRGDEARGPAEGSLDGDQAGHVGREANRAEAGHGPREESTPSGSDSRDSAGGVEAGDSQADPRESQSLLAGKERTLADRRAEAAPERLSGKERTLADRRAEAAFKRQQRDNPQFKDGDAPTGWDSVEPEQTRLTAGQAEDYVRPIREAIGADIQVHADHSTLPERTQQAMREHNHSDPRGVYSPDTDTVHVVAGAHADPEALQRTVVHELAHRNMREMLGDNYEAAMRDLYENIHSKESPVGMPSDKLKKNTARDWMSDYMDKHNLDSENPDHQTRAANEYAAHLAEHPTENPGVWRRVVDAVRAGLRRLGVVHEWTDNDIRALLRKSGTPRVDGRVSMEPHFADADEATDDTKLRSGAEALRGKATVEDQSAPDPRSAGKKAKDAIAQTWGNTLRTRLGGISLHNLPDFLPLGNKRMPAMEAFNKTVMRQAGRKQTLLGKKTEIAKAWEAWAKENPKLYDKQTRLMGASTLTGIDPSKPLEDRYTDEEKKADPGKGKHEAMRQNMYAELRDAYHAIGPEGQEIFNKVRDSYIADRKAVLAGLFKRIEAAGLDGNTQRQMMAELRQSFEAGAVKGPYFPLARFGDLWAVAKHEDGTVASFARFETKAERKLWMDQRRAEGFTKDGQLDAGEKVNHRSTIDKIDQAFVAKVVNLLKGTTKDGAPIDPKGVLQDEIWQLYLASMPEMSMRKQLIHRQGRLGYSADQLRAFTYNGLHSANQIARLEYGHQLDKHMDDMEDQRRAIEKADPDHTNADRANALAHEYALRHEALKSPKSSPISSALTRFGSNWYLAFSPGTAFRILLQNPMIAAPTLGGTHGMVPAYRELTKSSLQWIRAKGDIGAALHGDEKLAFDEGHQLGVFTNTETRALSSGGNGDEMFTGKRNMVVRASQFLFNGAEHLNRQSTYLAAYRLARKEGMDHEAAVWNAVKQSRDSHFDYSQENRPRVLQGDVARVVGLFKTYSAGVTYRLLREGMDAYKHEDPETQAIARKTFAGLIAHQIAFGGVKGVPLMALAMGAASLALGTKDRPYDATAAAHQWLTEQLGASIADAIMSGPASVLSGASLSESANYNNLWYHAPDRNASPHDMVTDLLTQAAGAVAGVPVNIATGLGMLEQGHTWRGLEHMAPPAAAALSKAIRYGTQGVTTLKGDTIISKDEISGYQLALQAVGLTPEEIARTYDWGAKRKNLEEKILDRHQTLQAEWNEAVKSGNSADITAASEALTHFFQANPALVRNPGKSMFGSYRAAARRSATSVGGINMNPGLRDLDKTYGAAP